MKTLLPTLLVFLLLSTPDLVFAQSEEDSMREGILAFREGRYEVAERAFERITDADPTQAEAYFLLARLYSETPLENRSKANRALDKALRLEPDNLTYLVGRLQQLREESWNFFTEKIREQKRIELSQRILELDSTNAFAHEELGAAFIRDFWRYRNAIMLPTVRFGGSTFQIDNDMPGALSTTAVGLTSQSGQSVDGTGELGMAGALSADAFDSQFSDPNSVFLGDRFDIDALIRIGVPVQDLSMRAQRAYNRAIDHLKASLATDPRRRSVYDRMMEIYALKGEYSEALGMLEEMYAFYSEDPRTWLYLGLAQYRSGNLDAAAKSFETAMKHLSEDDREAFQTLDYLLSSDEERGYRQDPVAYASRFWTSKDPRYLTPYNERKLEHYARLIYADLLYGSEDLDLRGWDTERGRILVRYGVPHRDVVIVPQSTSQVNVVSVFSSEGDNSSPSGDTGFDQASGTPLKNSSFSMLEEANTFNIWDFGDFRFVFEDPFRNGEYRLYSPSAADISAGSHPWLNDYVLRARETFERVPEHYEYTAPGRQIELPYLVSAFKGEDGNSDIYVNYGIPVTREGLGQETIEITANIGTFLIGEDRDILVERRRTIYGLRGTNVRSFEEANIWVDTQHMQSPPGRHQLSMEFETAGGGTVAVQRREVDIPDFSGDALNVSDVMLAYRIEESLGEELSDGDIVRRGLSISPAPWSVFSSNQPIYLYFEVYDLEHSEQGQTVYEMEAILSPRDQSKGLTKFVKNIFGGTKGVSVSLPGSGTAADEGHYLILDAANQETGLYTLTLRVTDKVSGKSVEREQDLLLE
jgi:GWxTD domain-containing protein